MKKYLFNTSTRYKMLQHSYVLSFFNRVRFLVEKMVTNGRQNKNKNNRYKKRAFMYYNAYVVVLTDSENWKRHTVAKTCCLQDGKRLSIAGNLHDSYYVQCWFVDARRIRCTIRKNVYLEIYYRRIRNYSPFIVYRVDINDIDNNDILRWWLIILKDSMCQIIIFLLKTLF